MRVSLLVLFAGVVAALGTHFLMNDRGLVLVNWRGVEYTTSVPGAILLLLMTYLVVRIVVHLLRAPKDFGEAVGRQRAMRGQRKTTEGLIELAEGNFSRSERILAQSASASDTPVINYLNAARAAQGQGAAERRDNYLMLAYEKDKDAANAVLLTKAELQMEQGEHEEALATLRTLRENAPGHSQGMVMLARIHRALGDWGGVRDLLPQLRRKKALPTEELDAMAEEACVESLCVAGRSDDSAHVEAAWSAVPKPLRKKPAVLHAYVDALSGGADGDAAETVLRKALAANWDKSLVLDYGRLRTGRTDQQLSQAEAWLKNHPNDPALLLTAARLAMRRELWGKARSYLESSIAIDPRIDAYHLYGELLQTMGETEGAASAFRHGLDLATGTQPEVPKLDAPADSEKPAS